MFCKSLLIEILEALKETLGNYEAIMSLSDAAIEWWGNQAKFYDKNISQITPSYSVTTDVSDECWGAHSGDADLGVQ